MKVMCGIRLLSFVALGVAGFAAIAQDSARTFTPGEIPWKPSTRVQGLENADLAGDSSRPGPVVYRVKFPPNYQIQAHTHPDDRTYTVISGVWYVGWGTKFDDTKLKAMPAGSFYTEPANVPHFVTTKGEGAIVQITATGPVTRPKFVDPAYK